MQLQVDRETPIVESHTVTAHVRSAALTSIVPRRTGTEFHSAYLTHFPLELYYTNDDILGRDKGQQVIVNVKRLSRLAARVIPI